jgi:hypothetical protein
VSPWQAVSTPSHTSTRTSALPILQQRLGSLNRHHSLGGATYQLVACSSPGHWTQRRAMGADAHTLRILPFLHLDYTRPRGRVRKECGGVD